MEQTITQRVSYILPKNHFPKKPIVRDLDKTLDLSQCQMEEAIRELEKTSSELDLSPVTRDRVQQQAMEFVNNSLDELSLKDQVIWRENNRNNDGLPMDIASEEHTFQELLAYLKNQVLPPGCNSASGGDMAYVPSGGLHYSAIADFIASSINRACGVNFIAPGIAKLEKQLIRWACSVIGYPDTSLGTFTSGGSVATLIALCTARDACLNNNNNNNEGRAIGSRKNSTDSNFSLGSPVVYMTKETHTCVSKVLRIIGLSNTVVTSFIEVDEGYRMSAEALKRQAEEDLNEGLQPFLVVATCGTTNTGAIDPLEEISKICRQFDLWLHVDAAYGGFFALLDEMRQDKMRSLCLADSIVLDPHKTLFVPYCCGIVLVKEGRRLVDSFRADEKSSYMAHDLDSYGELSDNPCNLSPELSRPFRGLKLWIPLQMHGTGPFKACLKEKLLLTKFFYREVQQIGFSVGPEPELTVCIHRYLPRDSTTANDFNQKLLQFLRKDGRIFVSSTFLDGVFWLRICILQLRTRLRHVKKYLSLLQLGVKSLTDNDDEGVEDHIEL